MDATEIDREATIDEDPTVVVAKERQGFAATILEEVTEFGRKPEVAALARGVALATDTRAISVLPVRAPVSIHLVSKITEAFGGTQREERRAGEGVRIRAGRNLGQSQRPREWGNLNRAIRSSDASRIIVAEPEPEGVLAISDTRRIQVRVGGIENRLSVGIELAASGAILGRAGCPRDVEYIASTVIPLEVGVS